MEEIKHGLVYFLDDDNVNAISQNWGILPNISLGRIITFDQACTAGGSVLQGNSGTVKKTDTAMFVIDRALIGDRPMKYADGRFAEEVLHNHPGTHPSS